MEVKKKPAVAVSINTILSNDILIKILDSLPLNDLFTTSKVCIKWRWLFYKVCKRKKSLFFFDLKSATNLSRLYDWYKVVFECHENTLYFSEKFSLRKLLSKHDLATLFPNVENLSLSLSVKNRASDSAILDKLLTGKFVSKLTSLKIALYCQSLEKHFDFHRLAEDDDEQLYVEYRTWRQIFTCLNSVSSFKLLNHLTLFTSSSDEYFFYYPVEYEPLNLSNFPALKELNYGVKIQQTQSEILAKLSACPKLRSFRLLYGVNSNKLDLDALKNELPEKLKDLILISYSDQNHNHIHGLESLSCILESACANRLRSLRVNTNSLTLDDVLDQLKSSSITDLQLSGLQKVWKYYLRNQENFEYEKPLQSVTKLTLRWSSGLYRSSQAFDRISQCLQTCFPNLKMLIQDNLHLRAFKLLTYWIKSDCCIPERADIPISRYYKTHSSKGYISSRNLKHFIVESNFKENLHQFVNNFEIADKVICLQFECEFDDVELFEKLVAFKNLQVLKLKCLSNFFDRVINSTTTLPTVTSLHLDFINLDQQLDLFTVIPCSRLPTLLPPIFPNLKTLKIDGLYALPQDYFHLSLRDLKWFHKLSQSLENLETVWLLKDCRLSPQPKLKATQSSIDQGDAEYRFRYQIVDLINPVGSNKLDHVIRVCQRTFV